MITIPPALEPGDTIGVIAPAGEVVGEQLQQGLGFLREKGFQVRLGRHNWEKRGYLAGQDRNRAEDMTAMLLDPEIKAILAARGGYGCTRLLPLLDFDAFRERPVILQGYSDVTALLLALHTQCGVETYHGPMALRGFDTSDPLPWESCAASLISRTEQVFTPVGHSLHFLQPGRATGPLLGGCLSIVASLIGTGYLPSFEGAIFFFEDVGEEPYKIDRMLTHLSMATDLRKAAGVIQGRLHRCAPSEPHRSLTIPEILLDHFGEGIPIVENFPIGHATPQATLPIGRSATIDTAAGAVTIAAP